MAITYTGDVSCNIKLGPSMLLDSGHHKLPRGTHTMDSVRSLWEYLCSN